jgi:AraC-like DNA-binding protein
VLKEPTWLAGRRFSSQSSCKTLIEEIGSQVAINAINRKDMSLQALTFLLGFSEQSAFNHAFKRWTGHSPTHFIDVS